MIMPTLHVIYAEFGRRRAPLAWRDGVLLGEDRTAERQDLHRVLADLVRRASTDRREEWGRVVRSGPAVLVETRVDDGTGDRRVDVTAVLDVPSPGADLGPIAAEIAKVFADEGIAADTGRLEVVLERACAEEKSGPLGGLLGRLFAVAAAVGATTLIWRRMRARRARRSLTQP